MKPKTTTEEKKTTKNKNKLDFKKGMLGKFVSNKQAKLGKGKDKQKKKRKKTHKESFVKKGLMDKKKI